MKTIRKYAASGYDIDALTQGEQDALRHEARELAAMQRRAAIGDLFAAVGRLPLAVGGAVGTLTRRPGVG